MTHVTSTVSDPSGLAQHRAAVAAIEGAYAAIPPGSPVRLAKKTSNLFRFRDASRPLAWTYPRSGTSCR